MLSNEQVEVQRIYIRKFVAVDDYSICGNQDEGIG